MLSWRNISKFKPNTVEIINANIKSRISYFKKQEFKSLI